MSERALSEAEIDLTIALIRSRTPPLANINFQLISTQSKDDRARCAIALFQKLAASDRAFVERVFDFIVTASSEETA